MDADFWNNRYNTEHYIYGTQPNGFVVEVANRIPSGGSVLCIAEGEGRNAVFLAGLAHNVTAVDQSRIALGKAQDLATKQGVSIETVVADLAAYDFEVGRWNGVVATFAHLPPRLRRTVHRRIIQGLRPGGVVILEAYTPAQLAYSTGGPRSLELLMTLPLLFDEFAGLEFLIARELERQVIEGSGHTGLGAVVQILAKKP